MIFDRLASYISFASTRLRRAVVPNQAVTSVPLSRSEDVEDEKEDEDHEDDGTDEDVHAIDNGDANKDEHEDMDHEADGADDADDDKYDDDETCNDDEDD
eukprot:374079-Pyramimonas_sp.AAC.1